MKKFDLLYKITFLKYIYLLRPQDASMEMNKNQMLQSQNSGSGLKYRHMIVTSSPKLFWGPKVDTGANFKEMSHCEHQGNSWSCLEISC